jgi:hypothetical protein
MVVSLVRPSTPRLSGVHKTNYTYSSEASERPMDPECHRLALANLRFMCSISQFVAYKLTCLVSKPLSDMHFVHFVPEEACRDMRRGTKTWTTERNFCPCSAAPGSFWPFGQIPG